MTSAAGDFTNALPLATDEHVIIDRVGVAAAASKLQRQHQQQVRAPTSHRVDCAADGRTAKARIARHFPAVTPVTLTRYKLRFSAIA